MSRASLTTRSDGDPHLIALGPNAVNSGGNVANVDDDRRYWNPGGLFAERAVEYWRRPNRSTFVAITALVLASLVVGTVLALAIYSWI